MDCLELLKERKLKATPQRLSILNILLKHEHPNIDELYEQIKAKNPTISLATVYKNLNTMIEEGIVIEIAVANKKTRYDIYEYEHIHLICKNCGHIYDLNKEKAFLKEYEQMLAKEVKSKINEIKVVTYLENCSNC